MELLEGKKPISSKQLYHVAQRQNLKFYNENDEDEEKTAKNKEKNLQT